MPELTGIPSVLDALKRRSWTSQALCATPPYDRWVWVLEPAAGREMPPSVVKLFQVCQRCPVRVECLRSALEERSFGVMGIFGATTATERRGVLPVRSGDRTLDTDELEAAVALFEETLPQRMAHWQELAEAYRASMARFVLGGRGGPGRGHIGVVGRYAIRHGVSKSTARRRLRAKREAREARNLGAPLTVGAWQVVAAGSSARS